MYLCPWKPQNQTHVLTDTNLYKTDSGAGSIEIPIICPESILGV